MPPTQADPRDEIARFLDAAEADQESHLASAGLTDELCRSLDEVERSVEGHVIPLPARNPDGDLYQADLYQPEIPRYGAFETNPPGLPESDPQEHRTLPTEPRFRRRPLGRRIGARPSDSVGRPTHSSRASGYWCAKREETLAELDEEECADCLEDDCIYAGGEDEREEEWEE